MIIKKQINFFKKKRILITGNTGFIGSYLSIILSLLGSKVLGYALKKKHKGYLSNHKEYKKKIKTINSDILNFPQYFFKLNKFKPNIAIHLAAQPIVKYSYENTKKTYETNIMGTINFLETIKKINSIKLIIIFTSDKVYQNLYGKFLSEKSHIGGSDPYSSSKSAKDIIANSYKLSFFKKKNLIIVRAGNIIGGGDFEFSRIIPELFLSLNKNQKLLLRNPNAIRPWQHIFDVLNGLLLIILNNYKNIKNKTIVYNIGPNPISNVSVLKLVKYIKKKINKLVFYQNKNIIFSETKILKLSNKLIKKETKWKPLLTISKTINLTIEWYETFYKKQESIYQFSINQLKKFFKLY